MSGYKTETNTKPNSSLVVDSRKPVEPLHQKDSLMQFEKVFSNGAGFRSNSHVELLNRSRNSQPQGISRLITNLQRTYGNSYVRRLVDLSKSGDEDTEVSSETESLIHSKIGGGQPLDENLRTNMESSFGTDFRGVRIHTDSQSDSLNRSLNARAFTTGKDIFFGQGEYNPGSSSGRHLLAHELTHVVQQNGEELQTKQDNEILHSGCSCHKKIQTKLTVGKPGDIYEEEADRVADQVMRMPRTNTTIRRMCTDCGEELDGKASNGIQRMCSECEDDLHRKSIGNNIIQKQDEPVENIDPIEDANPPGTETSGETTPDPDPPNVSIELPSPLTIRVNGVMYTSPTFLVEGPNGSIVDLAPYTGSGIIDFPLAALESLGIPILSYYHFHYGRARRYLGQHFENAYALSGGTSFIRNALHYGYITSDDVTLFGAPSSYNFEHYTGIPHLNIVANPMDIGTMINVSYFNFPLVEGQNNPAVMFSINAPFDQNPFEAFTNLGGAIYHALSGDLYNMPGVTHSYPRFHNEPNAAIGTPATTTRISPKSGDTAGSITDSQASGVTVNRMCSECEDELQEKHDDSMRTANHKYREEISSGTNGFNDKKVRDISINSASRYTVLTTRTPFAKSKIQPIHISSVNPRIISRDLPAYPITYCRSIGVPCPAPIFTHGTVCRLIDCSRAATANLPFAISPGICIYHCINGRVCTCVLLGNSTSAICIFTMCDSPGQAYRESDRDALAERALALAGQNPENGFANSSSTQGGLNTVQASFINGIQGKFDETISQTCNRKTPKFTNSDRTNSFIQKQGGTAQSTPANNAQSALQDLVFFVDNPNLETNPALKASLNLYSRYSNHVRVDDVEFRILPESEQGIRLGPFSHIGGRSHWENNTPVIELPVSLVETISQHVNSTSPTSGNDLTEIYNAVRVIGHELHHLWREKEGHTGNPLQPVFETESASRMEEVRQNWLRLIETGPRPTGGVRFGGNPHRRELGIPENQVINSWEDLDEAVRNRIESGAERTDYIQGLYFSSAYLVEEIYTKIEEISYLRVQQRLESDDLVVRASRQEVSQLASEVYRLNNILSSVASPDHLVTPQLLTRTQEAMLRYLRRRYPNRSDSSLDSYEVIFYLSAIRGGLPPHFSNGRLISNVPDARARR